MSELSCDGQESKTVLHCDETPPQYHSFQPRQDILTSVIGNEYTYRKLCQQLDNLESKSEKFLAENTPHEIDGGLSYADYLQELSRIFTEMVQITNGLADVHKERVAQNPELCKAMSRLTTAEFSRIYASSRRGELAHEQNYPSDSPSFCGQLFELSATTDKTDGSLIQAPQFHHTAKVWETNDGAPAKPRKSFWKKILKPLARE